MIADQTSRVDLRLSVLQFEEQVFVTATRTARAITDVPASVSVVDREFIEDAPARNIQDLLRRTPGIDFVERSGMAARSNSMIILRGVPGTKRALFMMDGLPANDLGTGTLKQLNLVPLQSVEQVEGRQGAVLQSLRRQCVLRRHQLHHPAGRGAGGRGPLRGRRKLHVFTGRRLDAGRVGPDRLLVHARTAGHRKRVQPRGDGQRACAPECRLRRPPLQRAAGFRARGRLGSDRPATGLPFLERPGSHDTTAVERGRDPDGNQRRPRRRAAAAQRRTGLRGGQNQPASHERPAPPSRTTRAPAPGRPLPWTSPTAAASKR